MNEHKVYTRKGRLNKCGACRVLDYDQKQLQLTLAECRELLRKLMGE